MSPARVEIDDVDYTSLSPKFPLEEQGVSTVNVSTTLCQVNGGQIRRTLAIDIPTFVTYVTRDPSTDTETPFLGGLPFCLPEEVAVRSILTALRSLGVLDLTEDTANETEDVSTWDDPQSLSERFAAVRGRQLVHPAASNSLSFLLKTQIEALRLNDVGQLPVSREEDGTANTLLGMLGVAIVRDNSMETFTLPKRFDKVTVSTGKYGHFTLRLVPIASSDRDETSEYQIENIMRISDRDQTGLGRIIIMLEDENTLEGTITSPFSRDNEDPHERGWSQKQIDEVAAAIEPILEESWRSERLTQKVHQSLLGRSGPSASANSCLLLSEETRIQIAETERETLRRIGGCSCVRYSNDYRCEPPPQGMIRLFRSSADHGLESSDSDDCD